VTVLEAAPLIRSIDRLLIEARRGETAALLAEYVAALGRSFHWQRNRVRYGFAALRGRFSEAVRRTPSEDDWEPIILRATEEAEPILGTTVRRFAERAAVIGGEQAQLSIGIPSAFEFDHPGVSAFLEQHAAELVTGITEETRARLRAVLVESMAAGRSAQKTAAALTATFDDMGRRRAILIARTETAIAYEQGARIAMADRVAQGYVIEKAWLVNEPEDAPCIENGEAGWIPFAARFPSGAEVPPEHPNCECSSTYRAAN
jgi:hypothetical protein